MTKQVAPKKHIAKIVMYILITAIILSAIVGYVIGTQPNRQSIIENVGWWRFLLGYTR